MKSTLLFLGAFLCANLTYSQSEEKSSASTLPLAATTEKVKKVADVASPASELQLTGPAAKNPLASGRAGRAPATVRTLSRYSAKWLNGPRYKNLKPEVRIVRYGEPRRATRKLKKTGPRYKNRFAKTGGQ